MYINSIGILYTLIPLIFIVYIRCITPKFIDNFGVRSEIQLVLIPGACLVGFLALYVTLDSILTNEFIKHLLHLLNLFAFSSYAFYCIFIMTVWVIKMNKTRISNIENNRRPSSPIYNQTAFFDSKSSKSKSNDTMQITTLETVLKDEQGFGSFMSHVASVCTVCSIFLICKIFYVIFLCILYTVSVDIDYLSFFFNLISYRNSLQKFYYVWWNYYSFNNRSVHIV